MPGADLTSGSAPSPADPASAAPASAAAPPAADPPLRDLVLSGRFFGRSNAAAAERLAAVAAGGADDWKCLSEWFGPVRAARLLTAPDDLRCLIDRDIAAIDDIVSAQVDAILHAPRFRRLEGSWRGLAWLVAGIDSPQRLKVRLLSAAWTELCRDMERAADFDQSNLFRRIYEDEFGSPGGEPFGLIVIDHEVRHRPAAGVPTDDVTAVATLASIGAAAFAPVVLSASPALLDADGFEDLGMSADPAAPFRAPSHMRWRTLAQRDDARFVCVTMPRLLARPPWGDQPHCRYGFRYIEHAPGTSERCWMTAGYAFAYAVARAFAAYNWPADVRGVETDVSGGGLIDHLPAEDFSTDPPRVWPRPPLDVILTDRQERSLIDAGLMPLTAMPFTAEAAFCSVRSLQTPQAYAQEPATANARISTQINSMLCVGRFAHYLKVMGRDMVGSFQTSDVIEKRLQTWLQGYVNANLISGRDNRARYPLQAGRVTVAEKPGKPGVFGCTVHIQPHYQLDDLSATFRLVTEISSPGRRE